MMPIEWDVDRISWMVVEFELHFHCYRTNNEYVRVWRCRTGTAVKFLRPRVRASMNTSVIEYLSIVVLIISIQKIYSSNESAHFFLSKWSTWNHKTCSMRLLSGRETIRISYVIYIYIYCMIIASSIHLLLWQHRSWMRDMTVATVVDTKANNAILANDHDCSSKHASVQFFNPLWICDRVSHE